MSKSAIKNMTWDECHEELDRLRGLDAELSAARMANRQEARRLGTLKFGWMRRALPLERRKIEIETGQSTTPGEAAEVAAQWEKVFGRFSRRVCEEARHYKLAEAAEMEILKNRRRAKAVSKRLRSNPLAILA